MAAQESKYTPEEVSRAAEVIRGSIQETGRYPTDIFFAVCETALLPTVELIIVQPGTDKIMMTQREHDDPYFPAGMWHVPGKMTAKEDTEGLYPDAIDNAAVRTISELGGTRITSLVRLPSQLLYQPTRVSARGPELSIFYGAYLIDDEPNVGRMFDATKLPDPMLENHRDLAVRGPAEVHLAHASRLRV